MRSSLTPTQLNQLAAIRVQVEADLMDDEATERNLQAIGCTDDDLMDAITERLEERR